MAVDLVVGCDLHTRKGLTMRLRDRLFSEIQKHYGDGIKTYQIDRLLDHYLPCVLIEINESITRPENPNGELSLSLLALDAIGIIRYQGRRYKLQRFMNLIPETRLFDVVFSGNIGKYSRVVLNPSYQDDIMKELLDLNGGIPTPAEKKILLARANHRIPIDQVSLNNFIIQADHRARTASGGLLLKIVRDLKRARTLNDYIECVKGQYYLSEYRQPSDSGREYGHGLSVQNLSRELRHAVLGVCHQYDFQAHSFAVMASLARAINPELSVAQITDYIRYRQPIRQRIARDVGVTEAQIKGIFTSLGFGARPVNNPYNSIRKILPDDASYQRLLAQQEFLYITQELEQINATILNYWGFQGAVEFNGYTFTETETGPSGRQVKKSDNQRLAWIYQNLEAQLTRKFIEIIRERTGLEPLTTVHDCIYYRQQIPASALVDVQVILRESLEYVRVEHTAIWPLTTAAGYSDRLSDQAQWEQEHQERIRQSELEARGYVSPVAQTLTVQQSPGRTQSVIQDLESGPDYTEYTYEYDWRTDV